MILNLFVLSVIAAAWIAALWFALQPHFSQWSIGSLTAMHVVPPLLIWGAWRLIVGYWSRKRARQAQESEARREATRQEQLAAVRRQHEQELAIRHFHCECRWVGLQVKAAKPERLPDIDLPNARVDIVPAEPDLEDDEFGILAFAGQEDAVGGFAPQLYELLLRLYDDCPAASVLPLYVVPPAHLGLEEVRAGLARIHGQIVGAMEPQPSLPDGKALIRFLPHADSAVTAVLSVFEADPELPGLVILAFDSPLAYDLAATPEIDKGAPAQSVVALLMTAQGLSAALAERIRESVPTSADALTPYWEKGTAGATRLHYLSAASPSACRVLIELPVLAQIRRAAHSPDETPVGDRLLEAIHRVRAQLERAEINAGLRPLPFLCEGSSTDGTAEGADDESPAHGWLIHNAGPVGRAGARLAMLGSALTDHGSPLDPIDQGTNAVTALGNSGAANSVSLMALATLRCADVKQPVLCAEFAATGKAIISFAVPGAELAPANP